MLLRLNLLRGVLWITAFSVVGAGRMFTGALPYTWLVRFLSLFLAAAIPGLALIGARTRPWMIVPAAACFSAAVVAINGWLDASLPIVVNVPYAAILLYGTQRIERQSAN
jgi:hypothetical protein